MGQQRGGTPDPGQAADLAEFIGLLGELRAWAGMPSYRSLAKRVGPLMRPARVVSPFTVVDAFKAGRRRLDLDLVVAIVRALGMDDEGVDRWRAACLRVHREVRTGGPAGVLRQLPPDLATFTGRAQELAWLTAAGDGGTVVISAIEGMAGIGKTQLALHAAHCLVRAGRHTDVQLYVNLRGFDPEHEPAEPGAVLGMFLRQLEVPAAQVPAGLAERAAMFRDRMQGRAALVILDNAANSAQVRDLLPAAPSCLVLITSRRSLADLDGAVLHQLGVFSPEEAVLLLSRVVGTQRVAAEPEAAGQIVRACGYVPLAVSIVASRLRARPAWRLADMARRLDRGVGEIVSAERGLVPVFDLSYQGLPEPARNVFQMLGVHPGTDFTAAAVAALSGLGISEAEAVLELLLDEHLVEQRIPGRYELHDLLLSYARTLAGSLPAGKVRDAVARLTEYHLRSVVRAGTAIANKDRSVALPETNGSGVEPEQFASYDAALAWFDAEHANLLAGIGAAMAHQLYTTVWNTAFALRFYQQLRRHIDDWTHNYGLARAAARAAGDQEAEARSLNGLCGARRQGGWFQQAAEYGRQAHELYRRLGDRVGESIALNNLAVALRHMRRFEEAAQVYEQAIAISHALGDSPNEGVALTNAIETYVQLGHHERALRAADRALKILRAVGYRQVEAMLLATLAELHETEGSLPEAEQACRQSLVLAEEVRDRHLQADNLRALGQILARADRAAEADAAWAQAQLRYESLGDQSAAAAVAQMRQIN